MRKLKSPITLVKEHRWLGIFWTVSFTAYLWKGDWVGLAGAVTAALIVLFVLGSTDWLFGVLIEKYQRKTKPGP
jgi:hypothetical protein